MAPGPDVLDHGTLQRIDDAVKAICDALDCLETTQHLVEAGLDLVLDSEHQPWLIEVNSRPRGRMEVLASTKPEAYLNAHIDACARPLEVIAGWMARD